MVRDKAAPVAVRRRRSGLAQQSRILRRLLAACVLLCLAGCSAFVPLGGVPASYLPPQLKGPSRSGKRTIDLSLLTQAPPPAYLVNAGDVLGVYVEGILGQRNEVPPVHFPQNNEVPPSLGYPIPVRADGTISLPLIEPIDVSGMTIRQVEEAIRAAYTKDRRILQPGRDRILVSLQRPRTYRILVIRQESQGNFNIQSLMGRATINPGNFKRGTGKVVTLPAYKNDVLHALAETGGLPGLNAENTIYVIRSRHRDRNQLPRAEPAVRKDPPADSVESPKGTAGNAVPSPSDEPAIRQTSAVVDAPASPRYADGSRPPGDPEAATRPRTDRRVRPARYAGYGYGHAAPAEGTADSEEPRAERAVAPGNLVGGRYGALAFGAAPRRASQRYGAGAGTGLGAGHSADSTAPVTGMPHGRYGLHRSPAIASRLAAGGGNYRSQLVARGSRLSAAEGSPTTDSQFRFPAEQASPDQEGWSMAPTVPPAPAVPERSAFPQDERNGRDWPAADEGWSAPPGMPGEPSAAALADRSPDARWNGDEPAAAEGHGDSGWSLFPRKIVGEQVPSMERSARGEARGPDRIAASVPPSKPADPDAPPIAETRPSPLPAPGPAEETLPWWPGAVAPQGEFAPGMAGPAFPGPLPHPNANVGRTDTVDDPNVVKIPVRLGAGQRPTFTRDDVILEDGDIVFIESRETEIFYTGGLLGGGQYMIPRDYDLDVLGAISIAESRSQGGGNNRSIGGTSALNRDVTIGASKCIILRQLADGRQFPIHVNLYRAIKHPEERILIQPGDYVILGYTPLEAVGAFIERHLLEGALFGVAAASLNNNNHN